MAEGTMTDEDIRTLTEHVAQRLAMARDAVDKAAQDSRLLSRLINPDHSTRAIYHDLANDLDDEADHLTLSHTLARDAALVWQGWTAPTTWQVGQHDDQVG